ncbi:Ig-like domain-containing protein [Nocardioides flavescens]|uniref:Ig-like domain-containing protein n=1 Tax=Nocardioides flavescens TaxID=2691959 RepID=A0A6L7ENE2_9ACTN|nr:Ig-like domain-containing protein [Nocardioides flavescens]MXG88847.1 hypothetical protein [Nocardioides flavescens]
MTPRRRALASALLAATTTAGLATLQVPAAQAATGSAPVTAPDAVSVFAGGSTTIEPLQNDTDPDGDQLALCRTGDDPSVDPTGKPFFISADSTSVTVMVSPRVEPGTYTVTYYACDLSYLTPGTITLTVEKAPEIKAVAVKDRPGLVRFKNPADFAVLIVWGARNEEDFDGSVRVPSGESRTVRVHHERVIWAAFSRKFDFFKFGRVTVELPNGDRHPPVQNTDGVTSRSWLSRLAPR